MEKFPIYRQTNWGFDQTHLLNQEDITIKTLFLYMGEGTSLQKHQNRYEVWVPINKTKVVKGIEERKTELNEDEFIVIPKREIHRLIGLEDASIITEISYGNFDEKDIERLHDFYGRV